MLCIENNNTDPYFNLAAEEYILRNFDENCFMLWQNKPSIIVGKHQNALAEINYTYVKENNIDVIRRLSGGGTVFHDLGNLNFTFIQNVEDGEDLVDFKRHMKPIVEVLQQQGINAMHEGRNDIMIDGRKVSGNAEHVFKKRVLHHGTLLFSSEISDLSKALKVNPLIYQDKGVKSVKSRVTNINKYLPGNISVLEFKAMILNFIKENESQIKSSRFSNSDIQKINKIVKDKYSTWEWNFGYSPKYNFERITKFDNCLLEIEMSVEKGIIIEIKIQGESKNIDFSLVEKRLVGIKHEENLVQTVIEENVSNNLISKTAIKQLSRSFF